MLRVWNEHPVSQRMMAKKARMLSTNLGASPAPSLYLPHNPSTRLRSDLPLNPGFNPPTLRRQTAKADPPPLTPPPLQQIRELNYSIMYEAIWLQNRGRVVLAHRACDWLLKKD